MKKQFSFFTLALVAGISTSVSAQTLSWAKLSANTETFAVSSDPSSNSYLLTGTGLEKRNSGGTLVWNSTFISNTDVYFYDVAADRLGNTYLGGIYVSEKPAANPAYTLTIGTNTVTLPTLPSQNSNTEYNMILAKVNSSGNLVWIKNFNSISDISDIRCVATDASNNVYVFGRATHMTSFDNGYVIPSNNAMFLAKLNSSGNTVFAKVIANTTSTTTFAYVVSGKELAVNDAGEIALTGEFSVTIQFDPYGTPFFMGGSTDDVFIARYNSSGAFQWAKRIGGTTAVERLSCIQIDNSGNTYCGGLFSGTINFNPPGTPANRTPVGGKDMFIVSHNSAGTFRWVSTIGGTGDETRFGMALTDFDFHLTGYFSGTVDFNPGSGTNNLTSAGGTDIFGAGYDLAGGVFSYAYQTGNTGNDKGHDICGIPVANNISLIQTGYFENTVDFNPGSGTTNLTATASSTVYISKITADVVSGRLANSSSANSSVLTTTVYPNPFEANLHLSFASDENNYLVTVYSMDGRLVHQTEYSGMKEADMDVSGLESGIYLMNIVSGNSSEQVKIVRK